MRQSTKLSLAINALDFHTTIQEFIDIKFLYKEGTEGFHDETIIWSTKHVLVDCSLVNSCRVSQGARIGEALTPNSSIMDFLSYLQPIQMSEAGAANFELLPLDSRVIKA